MDQAEYERLTDALARGHSVSVRDRDGARHLITRQADLDQIAGQSEQGAPSPRELRAAQLGKLNTTDLVNRSMELGLENTGTKAELAARILEMEFPVPQE